MPYFDVVSDVDLQEIRNAVDQANRELATRCGVRCTKFVIGTLPWRVFT